MKKKATCEDIRKIVKILKKHEVKSGKDGMIELNILKTVPEKKITKVYPTIRGNYEHKSR